MLSKEEIEKGKERVSNLGKSIQANCKEKSNIATSIEILLKYIDQLENENKTLKHTNKSYKGIINKQNKIMDEMTKVIIDSSICDYFIRDNCKHYAGENKKLCDECIKQYFEKKVEEK